MNLQLWFCTVGNLCKHDGETPRKKTGAADFTLTVLSAAPTLPLMVRSNTQKGCITIFQLFKQTYFVLWKINRTHKRCQSQFYTEMSVLTRLRWTEKYAVQRSVPANSRPCNCQYATFHVTFSAVDCHPCITVALQFDRCIRLHLSKLIPSSRKMS